MSINSPIQRKIIANKHSLKLTQILKVINLYPCQIWSMSRHHKQHRYYGNESHTYASECSLEKLKQECEYGCIVNTKQQNETKNETFQKCTTFLVFHIPTGASE